MTLERQTGSSLSYAAAVFPSGLRLLHTAEQSSLTFISLRRLRTTTNNITMASRLYFLYVRTQKKV